MRTSKSPNSAELLFFIDDRKLAAKTFNVCEKTIIRWLKLHNLYVPRKNYGHSKLNMKKAKAIRVAYKKGSKIKELAAQYKVTQPAISRIIHNITYKEKDVAEVKVIYNPSTFLPVRPFSSPS